MNKRPVFFALILLLSAFISNAQSTHTIWLDDLAIPTFSEGLRPVNVKKNYGDDTIRIGGAYYDRGLGLQSVSVLAFYLEKKAAKFSAIVGADDQGNKDIP